MNDELVWLVAALLLVVLLIIWLVVWWLRRRRVVQYKVPVAYGLDFSWSRPAVEAIVAAGYEFVCRYLSHDTTGKNLTASEADGYLDAGITIVSNWESWATRAGEGHGAGQQDAIDADAQHLRCGGGPADPIYFSADWDVQDWEYPSVAEYYRGIASVIGVERTGAYGGRYVIGRLFDDKLITFGWQTYAWSYGEWDPRAQLRQVKNNVSFAGATVDLDEAWSDIYGGWGQATSALPVGSGTVLITCPTDKSRLDLFFVGQLGEVWHRWYHGGMDALWNGVGGVENLRGAIVVGTLTAAWSPDGRLINVAGLGQPDPDSAELVPAGCGQYWGYTLGVDGAKSGWGSFTGVFGRYPGPGPI